MRRSTTARPTVIIAYTIKGYGLPIQGHPQNHSSLLSDEQFADLAATLGRDAAAAVGPVRAPTPRRARCAMPPPQRLRRDKSR